MILKQQYDQTASFLLTDTVHVYRISSNECEGMHVFSPATFIFYVLV